MRGPVLITLSFVLAAAEARAKTPTPLELMVCHRVAEAALSGLGRFARQVQLLQFVDYPHAAFLLKKGVSFERFYGEAQAEDFLAASNYLKGLPRGVSLDQLREVHRIASPSVQNPDVRPGEWRREDIFISPATAVLLSPDQAKQLRDDPRYEMGRPRGLHEFVPATRYLTENEVARLQRDPLLKIGGLARRTLDGKPQATAYIHYPPAKEVEKLAREFLRLYNENPDKLPPLEHAAQAYQFFIKCHLFRDGNGRVGRMLLERKLREYGLSPTLLRDPDSDIYMSRDELVRDIKEGMELWRETVTIVSERAATSK